MTRILLIFAVAAAPFYATQCKEDVTRPCPPSECIVEKDSTFIFGDGQGMSLY